VSKKPWKKGDVFIEELGVSESSRTRDKE